MLKVALTHDVDRTHKTYQYLTHFIKAALNREINNALYQILSVFKKNSYWNFDEIIRIENEYNVKSTFFFLNESIKFNPFSISNWKLSVGRYNVESSKVVQIIQWLDKNGWEIGVHGSYNSYKDKELLLKEKKILENIVRHEIVGVRQHHLNLDGKTWLIQKKCGFKYDSSFGFTDSIGFKDNKIVPFNPFRDDFLVFPLTIMDSCFIDTENRWERFKELLNIVQEKDALLVINWHQRSFNKKEFPEYVENYTKIIEECRDKNAKFCTLYSFANIKLTHLQDKRQPKIDPS